MKELNFLFPRMIETACVAILLTFMFPIHSQAQPTVEWNRSYGGSADDNGRDIQETSDGGFIMISTSNSTDGDLFNLGNDSDFNNIWLVRTSYEGDILWQKLLGGNGQESAGSVVQTFDEGFLVVGTTSSNDEVVSESFGNQDIWVVRLNADGDIEWEKSFGGSEHDLGVSGFEDSDGGFIISGFSNSTDGHMTGNAGSHDGLVLKLNTLGDILWQKTIGGEGSETISDISKAEDGGYIVSGITANPEGALSTYDYWLVKLSSNGNNEWERTYGGSNIDKANSVQSLSDGSFIVVGSTFSNDGDIGENLGGQDVWVLKLDNEGDIIWEQTYGGSFSDSGYSIQVTSDGGFVIAGFTSSQDGDVDPVNEFINYWILKLNNEGVIEWEYSTGGLLMDVAYVIRQTTDGGFIIGGTASSDSGDVMGHHGEFDFWVVKLDGDPLGVRENTSLNNMTFYPNPSNGQFFIRNAGVSGNYNIEVMDISGRRVHTQQATLNANSSIAVNLGHVTAGIYMVKMTNTYNESVSSQRVVVQ